MAGECLVKVKKGELIAPQIEFKDISTLNSADACLSELKKTVKKEYEEALETAINGASHEVTKRNLPFFRPQKYDYLDPDFFDEELGKISREIAKELFPEELSEIKDYDSPVEKARRELRTIRDIEDIFLRYFFLTPVNKEDWVRFVKETVPVAESRSILFGAYKDTRVTSFDKTLYEEGHAQKEDMQMMPFPLKEEDIDFYVGKIVEATLKYNAEIEEFSGILSKFKREEIQEPGYLERTVSIANDCLTGLVKKPYSKETGAYAVRLYTAISMIDKGLEKRIGVLEKTARDFSELTITGNGRALKSKLEGMGFEVYEKKDWEGYVRKTYALRETS